MFNISKTMMFIPELTSAILNEDKIQTRRTIKFGLYADGDDMVNDGSIEIYKGGSSFKDFPELKQSFIKYHSKYQIGDIVWLRESVRILTLKGNILDKSLVLVYKYNADSDNRQYEIKLPDRFYGDNFKLPNWVNFFGKYKGIPNGCIKEMARTFLKITDVKIEELQDISEQDLIKEGITTFRNKCKTIPDFDETLTNQDLWGILWDSTAKKNYKCADNPTVWVYEFSKISKEELANV